MIAITGATGQLGQLVITQLLQKVPAHQLIAIVRSPAKAANLSALGIQIRQADYQDSAALESALQGVEKLLLISSSEVGQRLAQHRTVIDAAKTAGVKLLAYTSILNAEESIMALAQEHRATEHLIKAAGIPFVFLRNGWYSENYTASIPSALQFNALLGSAGSGKISLAARVDYAAAAAEVLVRDDQAGKTYELAGDTGYTLADFAAELSRQTGQQIPYNNLPEAEYRAILQSAGLPDVIADLLAASDASAAEGALFDGSQQLRQLIGRATTPLADSIKTALTLGAAQAAH
jgi:NAD(P)H dehydrogenase (quinone)